MKKIISIVGARPQFIKHAAIQIELQKHYITKTIHTGQHYDDNMSEIFFSQLNIPRPEYLLDLGNAKLQGEQTGVMMKEIEKIIISEKPDAILVYGDTNSTLAGGLVAVKELVPLIHIESGLRSFNREMPEEVNRIITDVFSHLLFCPTENAIINLRKEGINHDRIYLVGDVMCDMMHLVQKYLARPNLDCDYYFATIHRPYNTDSKDRLSNILKALNGLDNKVLLSIHPRTLSRMQIFGLTPDGYSNIMFCEPLSYIDSIIYQKYSKGIITDSGGIQKEAYILKKKCVTLRTETEWTETLKGNWNKLNFDNLLELSLDLMEEPVIEQYQQNIYGDGFAAKEIVNIIKKHF